MGKRYIQLESFYRSKKVIAGLIKCNLGKIADIIFDIDLNTPKSGSIWYQEG